MYFTAPATLIKSETEFKKNRINVKVIASDETLDQEQDQLLAKCFTDDVRDYFLKSGIFDWDHMTIRGQTSIDKGSALIGTPTAFYEERFNGAPIQMIEGYLHRGNPHVDNAIEPCLKAGSDRLGTSVGGKILGHDPNEYGGRSISKIFMNHLAFTPKHKSINLNTKVELVKGLNGETIYKFKKTSDLLKSMEAGFETDMAAITGPQAMQPQSLEGSPILLEHPHLEFIGRSVLHDLVSGLINFDDTSIMSQAQNYGLGAQDAKLISNLLLNQLANKINRLRGLYNKSLLGEV